MKRKEVLLLVFMVLSNFVFAQVKLDSLDQVTLRQYEKKINELGATVIASLNPIERQQASHQKVKLLVEALKVEGSFNYHFDSLTSISTINAPDNSFRIFTWQMLQKDYTYRFYGAIQMNTPTLKLFPLVDYSVMIDKPHDKVLDNERWYGALYYDIIKTQHKESAYYTLLGWDGNNSMSTKKIMEVLWFNDEKEPRFGAPIFSYGKKDTFVCRYVMEYKENSVATLRRKGNEDKVYFDHLIPVNEQSEGYYFNYVPDGSYCGFEWVKGKWQYIDKIFHSKLKEGEFPQPNAAENSGLTPK